MLGRKAGRFWPGHFLREGEEGAISQVTYLELFRGFLMSRFEIPFGEGGGGRVVYPNQLHWACCLVFWVFF